MLSGGLLTLQGCTLQRGRCFVSTGVFKGINTVECIADGTFEVTWKDNSTETLTMTAGYVNPIECKQVEILSGTFNVANV